MKAGYFFAGVLTTLLIVAIATGGFFLGRNNSAGEEAVTPAPVLNGSSDVKNNSSPTVMEEKQETFDTLVSGIISNKDYKQLEIFMVDPVSVRIEASGCCQPMTPAEAIVQMEYLDSAESPWNFDQENVIVFGLKSSYPEHYGNAVVGISEDGYVVALQLNEDNEIAKVSMATDYELLLP